MLPALLGLAQLAFAAPSVTDAPDVAGGAAAAPAVVAAAPLNRPRVCLVLSGGGARGAAHIGVIRVLEELNVPVDCIAGTSMGAVVGGAYASGMTVTDMLRAIDGITFDSLFTDKPPRSEQSMRIKADSYLPLAAPEFGVANGSLTAPQGVVGGVALEAQLRALVKVGGASDFDHLPIPFRAVATSLGDGGMVVFERGALVTAMRASMSVPALIAPLNVNGQLLVDGGLVRNLPIDVARAMGADVIIAVNLGTPLLKPAQIQGLRAVAMQTLGILTEQNVRESLQQLRDGDVLIQPALGDFSAADFDDLVKTVPIGEAAARAAAGRLSALALPAAAHAALRASQSVATQARPAQRIAAIEVRGNRRVTAEVIAQRMQTQVGDVYDAPRVDLDMRRIFGSGDFESVRSEQGDEATLVVNVTEKAWGPDYLRFGLALSSDLGQDATFNLLANWRSTWLNRWGGEWRGNLLLGNDVLLNTSLYQPLSDRQYFFVEPHFAAGITPLYIYNASVLLSEYRNHFVGVGLDLGANFSAYGEARLGIYRGRSRYELATGPPTLPADFDEDIGLVQAALRIDRLDSVNFTRSGYLVSLIAQSSQTALGASDSFTRVEGGVRGAYSFGNHTLQLAVRGGEASSELPAYALFKLGGFLNMSGYRRQQLLGTRYAYGQLLYQLKLAQLPLFEGVYGGLAYEAADMPQLLPGNDKPLFQSGTAFLGADTPLGAAYFGLGYGGAGNQAVYLFLGRPF